MGQGNGNQINQHRKKTAGKAQPDNGSGVPEAVYLGKNIAENISNRKQDNRCRKCYVCGYRPHLSGNQVGQQQTGHIDYRHHHKEI